MDKFCEDCIHNEVCQYYAIPPHKDRCNDKDTIDDIRPRGEWIEQKKYPFCYNCNQCGTENTHKANFCEYCGAEMKGGAE